MIHVRTANELERLRACGRINALIHQHLRARIEPGVSTRDLDTWAAQAMREYGVRSSIQDPLGFPGTICVSVNAEVGHGIPGSYRLRMGDLVKVDVSVELAGYHTDCAATHVVGTASAEAQHLVETTRAALSAGIACAEAGRRCSDISHAIGQTLRRAGCASVRRAFGHGIGTELHEAPQVANFGPAGYGPRLRPGMVMAIEPLVSSGSAYTRRHDNGWTDVTLDSALAAHFEHTIAVTDGAAEVLTAGADVPPTLRYRSTTTADEPWMLELAARELDPILMAAWGRKVSQHEIFDPALTSVIVLAADGSRIGFFSWSVVEGDVHLHTLVIAAPHQGSGVGTLVMRELEAIAAKRGLQGMRLCVQTNNERAMRFYRKLGYRKVDMPYANTLLLHKRRV